MLKNCLKIKNLKLKIFGFEILEIIGFFILLVLYSLSRSVNLTIIPVFCDEAIYIRWAQVMRAVPALRFIPLSDGKQPLFMWLVIPFLKVLKDPLVAGRMVSVLSGFGSMIGIGVLSYLLFKRKGVSLFAMILYLISPFALFFDRMALVDGLLSVFGVWFLISAILLLKTLRLDTAMIAGIVLGLGLITKSPAMIFALMLPITFILFKTHVGKTDGASSNVTMEQWNNVIKLFLLWGIVYLFALAINNILRLGPEFHMIAIRNKDYVFPISEVLKHPFNPLIGHFKDTITWYWILVTPLIFLGGLIGIFLLIRRNFRSGILLLVWFVLPIIGQSAIARVYTTRYILFSVPFFLIFGAFCLSFFWRSDLRGGRTSLVLLLLVIFTLPLYQDFLLLTNPQKAWLPANERSGYLEIWTAGYGIREAAEYLKNIANNQKILVGTEGYFGTLPNGLEMYLEKVPNVTIIGVGYPIKEIPQKLSSGLVDNRVFLLVNDSRLQVSSDSRLKLIKSFPKAQNSSGGRENLLLFEISK